MLQKYNKNLAALGIADLFAADPGRIEFFSPGCAGLQPDYSRPTITIDSRVQLSGQPADVPSQLQEKLHRPFS